MWVFFPFYLIAMYLPSYVAILVLISISLGVCILNYMIFWKRHFFQRNKSWGEPSPTAYRSTFQSEKQTRMNCRTQHPNLNGQFMVGRFGMEMWMMTWNGCKMGVVPWPGCTNSCCGEGQGGQQE